MVYKMAETEESRDLLRALEEEGFDADFIDFLKDYKEESLETLEKAVGNDGSTD